MTDASGSGASGLPPLLLLDVDGVLNALGNDEEYVDAWPDWCAGQASADGTSWPIKWAPAVVEQLRRWHDAGDLEIQWLTTWGHDANGELRELLGLPELVVAGTYDEGDYGVATTGAAFSHAAGAPAAPDPLSSRWWKYDVVRRVIGGQPERRIIWVDDELHDPEGPFATWAVDSGLIRIGPDGMVGLEKSHLHVIAVTVGTPLE